VASANGIIADKHMGISPKNSALVSAKADRSIKYGTVD